MRINAKKLFAIITTVWLLLIGISAFWNISQIRKSQHRVNLETGRSFFGLIVTTRQWNAENGGVYVPVTDEIRPNQYLDDPLRDVVTTSGLVLTKLNPAYMTRLIAEFAAENNNVQFHITSLKPIRPENKPEEWERTALEIFETSQQTEYFEYIRQDDSQFFRYMAPLITEKSCLQCHEKQGYQEGAIRGGISLSFPVDFKTNWALINSHAVLALVGVVLIFIFGRKLASNIQVLEQQSQIDGLTQIYNRRYFDEYLQRELLRSHRTKSPLSVLIGDIDHFKPYNDFYGHLAGDDCLKIVAQTLQELLKRPGDIVTRYGGEEFVIVLPSTTLEGAYLMGETIRSRIEFLELPHEASAVSDFVTISLGVGFTDGRDQEITPAKLLEKADQALYRAKSAGRNRVVT